jgi:hypothetical protein
MGIVKKMFLFDRKANSLVFLFKNIFYNCKLCSNVDDEDVWALLLVLNINKALTQNNLSLCKMLHRGFCTGITKLLLYNTINVPHND